MNLDEYNEEEVAAEITRRARARKEGLCDYCLRPPGSEPCKFPARHRPNGRVCPACGSRKTVDIGVFWNAKSTHDPDQDTQLSEYQCRDCTFSFWL